MARHPPFGSFQKIPWAALALLLVVSLSALPVVAGAATNPRLTATCTRAENIVVDGGFEEETVKYSPLVCPCPLMPPWVTNQSGKGGTSAQRGWGTEGSYGAVVSLDDSKAGDWISISQTVTGDQYCTLNFTYSMWLSGERESDLFVYMDNGLIWSTHEFVQGSQPMKREVTIDVSSFSGFHTIRFLQEATRGGNAHSDWFIDDVRLMSGSFTTPRPETLLPTTTRTPLPTTMARPLITGNATPPPSLSPTVTMTTALQRAVSTREITPRPVITRRAPFNPFQFLSCIARRIHDEVFPFIPLKQGVDPGCT